MNKLKCWKKFGNGYKKENFGEISIWKGDVNRNRGFYKEDSKQGWSVSVDTKINDIDKTFKTKPQAKKFANKYMKKNDKC